ncbi:hypothetical protein [Nocardioides solisilvae]|uniref:hypothetical protein n=1 Tax=Nocardioides solisilvae TaxID=1542435 RepID=UPI000D74B668|nr:hypothetical protein [Nocardioides solisilvae]
MNERAYPPPETTRSKGPVLLLVGALVVLGALVPAAMWLDRGIDHERVMYADRQAMASLQHLAVTAGLEPVETSLAPGETLELATKSFTASPDVTTEVRREDAVGAKGDAIPGYCVRSLGRDGERTPWLCHDAEHPPAAPAGDPLADL